jgi:hypothetical protein
MKHLKKQTNEKQYEIDSYERNSVFAELDQWCFGYGDKHDYIEVTEWYNGEGFDVDIETHQRQRFQLSWGQWEALKYLVNKIENK